MKNYLIQGTLASGKTRRARVIACRETGVVNGDSDYTDDVYRKVLNSGNSRIEYLPIHEGCDYDSFVEGIEISTAGGIKYSPVDRVFKKLCKRAKKDPNQTYAIILDDIDKTDITSCFGELLYAIENRDCEVTLRSGDALVIPSNVAVILTISTVFMNNKPDYAFFRRFNIETLFSDRTVIEKLVSAGKVNGFALEAYDEYNALVKQHLFDRDLTREYEIGHGWFIDDSRTKIQRRICYQVIPLIQMYASSGIIAISLSDVEKYRKAAQESVNKAPIADRIRKIRKGISGTRDEEKEPFGYIVQRLKNKPSQPDYIRGLFEITWKSGLVADSKLMTDLYLNIAALLVHNKNPINKDASFLVEEKSSQNGFVYNDNPSHSSPSMYYSKGRSSSNYPVYNYDNADYMLMVGVRDTNKTVSFNTVEVAKRNTPKDSATAAPIIPIASRLVYGYYCLYKQGIIDLINGNPNDTNLNNLLIIIESDLEWLDSKKDKKDPDFCDEILDKNNLIILTSKEGDHIQKSINGALISATLKGVGKMSSNDYKGIMDSMNVRQMILQGPPGTSKTYGAKAFILSQIDKSVDQDNVDLDDAGNKGKLDACKIKDDWYKWAEGDPSGKAPAAQPAYWDIVQFHPSYGYEDFVRGITVNTGGSSIQYETINKLLGRIALFASKLNGSNNGNKADAENNEVGREAPVFLIIDEINRANVSTTFGELIYALEYRNENVATPYKADNVGDYNIVLPDNLYIIGTMNTADKSIGNIDYAVRRRFIFFPTLPDKKVVEKYEQKQQQQNSTTEPQNNTKLFEKVEKVFDTNLSDDFFKDDVQVGHTMFLAHDDAEMKNKFKYQVLPILREYYKDGILVSKKSDKTSGQNPIMDYLNKYGRKDCISEDDLWNALL
ncbi:MAG: AAA family ATPase [Eubacterium sp.]|nr:AAA family ATPase [Eubacterium sp.]